jgi:hypothetical protein
VLIFITTYPLGRLVNRLIETDSNLLQNAIVGLIINSIILTLFAFFLPINSILLTGLCLVNLFLIVFESSFYRKSVLALCKQFTQKQSLLVFFASIVLAIYSSASSKINDDGLYYSQTIKWLREYGFVHGISNLHVSLGLSSAWHILQSLYIFSDAVYTNDLNGFILLIYTIHFVSRIINKSATIFLVTQYFLVLLLSLPFLSAPNPDFPIIVFTAIALDFFMLNEHYKTIILIACFSITIKISAILLFLLGLYCLFLNRNRISKQPILLSIIFLFLHFTYLKIFFKQHIPFIL